MIRALYISLIALAAAACSSTSDAPAQKTAAAAVLAEPNSGLPPEGLPPQKLQPGECGLFLWGMAAPRRFVFFTKGTSSEALVLHEGAPLQLAVTEAGGDVFGQFFTEAQYLSFDGQWSVQLGIKPGEILEGGQRVDSGRLVIRGADGWETVQPVTGVRACLPG